METTAMAIELFKRRFVLSYWMFDIPRVAFWLLPLHQVGKSCLDDQMEKKKKKKKSIHKHLVEEVGW